MEYNPPKEQTRIAGRISQVTGTAGAECGFKPRNTLPPENVLDPC